MRTPPVVGYEVTDATGTIIAELELGWPGKKEGVYIGEKPDIVGWKLFSIQQAIDYYGR